MTLRLDGGNKDIGFAAYDAGEGKIIAKKENAQVVWFLWFREMTEEVIGFIAAQRWIQ